MLLLFFFFNITHPLNFSFNLYGTNYCPIPSETFQPDCLLELSFQTLQCEITESFHGNLCMFPSDYVKALDLQSPVSWFRKCRASKELYLLGTEVLSKGMQKSSSRIKNLKIAILFKEGAYPSLSLPPSYWLGCGCGNWNSNRYYQSQGDTHM